MQSITELRMVNIEYNTVNVISILKLCLRAYVTLNRQKVDW